MKLRDSMIMAVIISATAATFALTTSEQSDNPIIPTSPLSTYAHTLHQRCSICNESGLITDSINGTIYCPACGGSGEIIAQQINGHPNANHQK